MTAVSGARGGLPTGLRRLVARAMARDLDAFVVPDERLARAVGLDAAAAGLRPVATPRHASVLLLVGDLPEGLARAAAVAYAQMPRPRAILAVGADGSPFLPAPDVVVPAEQTALAAGVDRLRTRFAGGAFSPDAAALASDALTTRTEFVCPMHPEVVRDGPGSCPICGMDLVPREAAGATAGHDHAGMAMDHAAMPAAGTETRGGTAAAGTAASTFTCPMHPEIVRAEPGRCPICGMNLVPAASDDRAAVVHSTGHEGHEGHGPAAAGAGDHSAQSAADGAVAGMGHGHEGHAPDAAAMDHVAHAAAMDYGAHGVMMNHAAGGAAQSAVTPEGHGTPPSPRRDGPTEDSMPAGPGGHGAHGGHGAATRAAVGRAPGDDADAGHAMAGMGEHSGHAAMAMGRDGRTGDEAASVPMPNEHRRHAEGTDHPAMGPIDPGPARGRPTPAVAHGGAGAAMAPGAGGVPAVGEPAAVGSGAMDHRAMGHGAAADGMDHAAMGHGPVDPGTASPGTTDGGLMDHAGMGHGMMDPMDHGTMDHLGMDHGARGHGAMGHGGMYHGMMDHGGFMSMVAMTKDLPRSGDGLPMEWLDAPFGPLFPGLPGGVALALTLDGDTVARAALAPGATRRGLEASWPGPAATLPDRLARLDPLAPVAYRVLARRALEAAGGIAVDEAGARGRIGALERERAAGHLGWLAAFAALLGDRALAQRAARCQIALARAAGVEEFSRLRPAVRALVAGARRTPLVRRRLSGIGDLRGAPPEAAWGPVGRSLGIAVDERDADPAYDALGFQPAVEETGDALARLRVRLAEIERSLDLAVAAGSFAAEEPPLPGDASGRGEAAVETPRGAAVLRVEVDRGRVVRVDLDNRSRRHAGLVPLVAEGTELGDALVGVASLDLSPWEMDR